MWYHCDRWRSYKTRLIPQGRHRWCTTHLYHLPSFSADRRFAWVGANNVMSHRSTKPEVLSPVWQLEWHSVRGPVRCSVATVAVLRSTAMFRFFAVFTCSEISRHALFFVHFRLETRPTCLAGTRKSLTWRALSLIPEKETDGLRSILLNLQPLEPLWHTDLSIACYLHICYAGENGANCLHYGLNNALGTTTSFR